MEDEPIAMHTNVINTTNTFDEANINGLLIETI